MHRGVDEASDVGEEVIADPVSDVMGGDEVQVGLGSLVDFGGQLVTDPTHPQPVDADHTRYVANGVLCVVGDVLVDAVHHRSEHLVGRLVEDSEGGDPDDQRSESLAERHDRSGFARRSREQTDWLRNHAHQSVATDTTRVFVVTEVASPVAVAYYGWCRALLVHAASDEARDSYRHIIPEFEASPTDDLHLVLLMKDIRRTVRRRS